MKGNTKGFTLVELLAVIVILAIIALITIPAILNVINEARGKGAQDKAWRTIEAVWPAFTQTQGFGDVTINTQDVTFSGSTLPFLKNAAGQNIDPKGKINLSGEAPVSGSVHIDTASGLITATNLKFTANGDYTCSTNATATKMCCEANKTSVTCSWLF